jgi:hypothetical protein
MGPYREGKGEEREREEPSMGVEWDTQGCQTQVPSGNL